MRTPEEANRYGFAFGPMRVVRMWGEESGGWLINVETPAGTVAVHVSPKGRVMRVVAQDSKGNEVARGIAK